MNELRDQIFILLKDIAKVSDYLYQQNISKGYENLNTTLAGIMDISDKLFAMVKEGSLSFDGQRLIGSLTGAMKAMEAKDNVLLADILVYEITGQLQEIFE